MNLPTSTDPSIVADGDALINHVISITGNVLTTFFGAGDVRRNQIAPSG